MAIFYRASAKNILESRNKVFLERGVPALKECGFLKSPFLNSWFGKNNLGDYSYEFCRLASHSHLEIVTVHISKGDNWIKVFLNIFILEPVLEEIAHLSQVDGVQFLLPPNSITQMRLKIDNITTPPLFRMFSKQHKIGLYLSKDGFDARVKGLGELIYRDLKDIDYYVKRWHEIYKPLRVKWNGEKVDV